MSFYQADALPLIQPTISNAPTTSFQDPLTDS